MKFSSSTNARGFEPIDLTVRIESQKELEAIEDFLGYNVSIPDHYGEVSGRTKNVRDISGFMGGLHHQLQELRDAKKI